MRGRTSCRPPAGLLLLLLALLVAPLGGCGYTTGRLIEQDFRRVYLPMFQNETFWRDLEVGLTQQVQRELASRPGIFIVPRDEADIVLEGAIVDFRQRVLSEDGRDRVRESSALTTVRIDVKDARDGRLVKTYVVRDQAEFFTQRGENLATATEESFIDIARKIVQGLETGFPRASERAKTAQEEAPDA